MGKFFSALVLGFLFSVSAFSASGKAPSCLDFDRRPLQVNNGEVLKWKEQTPNEFKDRALVVGTLIGVILDRKSHLHLEMDLTPETANSDRKEHIEIIYNKEFGFVDNVKPGSEIVACGDYITSNDFTGKYKPSPLGAIIHWVHASNNTDKHVHGFLMIGGKVFGHQQLFQPLQSLFENFASVNF